MKALEDLVGKQFVLDFLQEVTYLFIISYNFRTLTTMHVTKFFRKICDFGEIRNKEEIRKRKNGHLNLYRHYINILKIFSKTRKIGAKNFMFLSSIMILKKNK